MHSRMSYSATTTPQPSAASGRSSARRVCCARASGDYARPRRAAPTTKHAQNHAEIREFVREQGIAHFFEVGRGICHQVLSEEAVVLPGQLILEAGFAHDALRLDGCVRRASGAARWRRCGRRANCGCACRRRCASSWTEPPPWVTAKDFALRVIGDLGADGGLYAMIEFGGSGIEALPLERA